MLLVITESCNSTNPDTNSIIDSNIKFKITEVHPVSGSSSMGIPQIHLILTTEKIYPCFNYGINLFKSISGRNITINLLGLNVPNICLTALGPASADVPMQVGNGEYNLNIKSKGITDSYIVNVSDSLITVSNKNGEISSPAYNKYYRFPKNSFAYYCGTTIEDKYICDDFLDTLKSKINIKEFYFPEDGQKPYPDSSMGHYYDMPAKFFIYNSEEDFDKIGSIMSSYKKSVIKDKQGIGISIVNWENKYFYSWLIK